jgi:hypothetical protein
MTVDISCHSPNQTAMYLKGWWPDFSGYPVHIETLIKQRRFDSRRLSLTRHSVEHPNLFTTLRISLSTFATK